jgi:CRP-like cAMP-binding protein
LTSEVGKLQRRLLRPTLPTAADLEVHPKTSGEISAMKRYLSRSPFFKCLGNDEMMAIIMAMRPRELRPGEQVIRMGDTGKSMFLTTSGALNCSIPEPFRKTETVVKICRAGDICGELAILYRRPRAAHGRCWKRAKVWELHQSVFRAVAMKNPHQWETLAQSIFDFFDVHKTGQLNKEDVREAMIALGGRLSERELNELMCAYDSGGSGKIDFAAFTRMLLDVSRRR